MLQTSNDLKEEVARPAQAFYSRKEVDYRQGICSRGVIMSKKYVTRIRYRTGAVNQLRELNKQCPQLSRKHNVKIHGRPMTQRVMIS